MTGIKNFIENNFSLLLLVGFIAGFFTPSLGEISDEIVIFLIAVLIFLSCADINTKDFFNVDVFQIGLFTLLRFAVFPLVLFYLAYLLVPEYAVGVLLLSLMPAGMAVASLCSMSKAPNSVPIGLSLTIISSLLAPFFIPAVYSFLGQTLEVDVLGLFITLSLVVFVPIILYLGIVRKFQTLHNQIKKYNQTSAVVILSVVLLIVMASQKEEFLGNLDLIVYGLIIMTVLFAVYYAFGIAFSLFVEKEQRVAYIFSSGAMNNSLAVGLAFAYFSPTISLFLVLSEIVFSFYIAVAQWWFSKRAQA
jgi:BASS family bile acid:Na+ symporter